MAPRRVLVMGATGRQGDAVARALLPRGHEVRGLVRAAEADSTDRLNELGVEPVEGDYDDRASLERAASGVDSVFAMTTPMAGVDVEVRQGIAVADAMTAAGIDHLVYSSVANADRQTGVPHFDSKYQVEEHIRRLDVAWTFVGPVWFMDNVLFPWNVEDLKGGLFRQPVPADRQMRMISSVDIGAFSALVLDQRDPFVGRRIDIAADELTGPEMAAQLSEAIGRSIEYAEMSLEEATAQMGGDTGIMYDWINRVGFTADIDGLRRDHPEVGWKSFRQWSAEQDWNALLS